MIKAIIGLGNPGRTFFNTRHNIGFRVIDELAHRYNVNFQTDDIKAVGELRLNDRTLILLKPLTYMNNSGKIIPFLQKKGVKSDELLVVHDELELPLGKLAFKQGGSARGHNGLKSIIGYSGDNFLRLRFGIGRPEEKEVVPDYVLQPFGKAEEDMVDELVEKAADLVIQHIEK